MTLGSVECVAQMLAICIETTQASDRLSSEMDSCDTDFSVFVAYFEELGQKWASGRIYGRMFTSILGV